MRIGLLTLPIETGYGSILQAYALKTVLERRGHQVIFIRRHRKQPVFSFLSVGKRIVKRFVFRKKVVVFIHQKIRNEYPCISQNIQPFIDKYLFPFSPVYYSSRELKQLGLLGCEAFVVGSDQVWHKGFMQNICDYFFGSINDEKIKLYAYAASFGVDHWLFSRKETFKCRQLIQRFEGVSVREASGVVLCEKYLGKSAVHVLDPTMLLCPQDYMKLVDKERVGGDKGVMAFVLDRTEDKLQALNLLAKRFKRSYFWASTETENREAPLEQRIAPSVSDWLYSFSVAEYVFTDSFHGCIFSILFHKPFVVYLNNGRGAGRFYSLLKLFDLETRLISSSEDLSYFQDKQIDWAEVDKKLDHMRTISYQFINTIS